MRKQKTALVQSGYEVGPLISSPFKSKDGIITCDHFRSKESFFRITGACRTTLLRSPPLRSSTVHVVEQALIDIYYSMANVTKLSFARENGILNNRRCRYRL